MILPIQRVPRYKLLLEGALSIQHIIHHYFIHVYRLPQISSRGTSRCSEYEGYGMLMVHRVVKLTLILCTAALAVISETALHMNSTIVDLVNPIACAWTLKIIIVYMYIRKGRPWC